MNTRLESLSVDPRIGESLIERATLSDWPATLRQPQNWTLEAKYANGEVRTIEGPPERIGDLVERSKWYIRWLDTDPRERELEPPLLPPELV